MAEQSYNPTAPSDMGALWEQYKKLLQVQGMMPMQLPMQGAQGLPPASAPQMGTLAQQPRLPDMDPRKVGGSYGQQPAPAQGEASSAPGGGFSSFMKQLFGPSGGPGAPTAPGSGQYRPGAVGVESPSSGLPNRAVDYIQKLGSGASIQDAVPLGEGGAPTRGFQTDQGAPAPPVPMPTGDPWGGATSVQGPMTADPTGDPSRHLAGELWKQTNVGPPQGPSGSTSTMAEIDAALDAAAKAGQGEGGKTEAVAGQPGDIRGENREALSRYGAGEFGSWLSGMPFAHAANKQGYKDWAPYPTQGLGLQYGEESDQISADERKYFKGLGVDIPMGMTRAKFNRMFGTSLTGGTDDRYIAAMEEGNRIRREKEQGIGERFEVGEKRRDFSAHKVSDAIEDDMRSLIKAKYKMADAGALRTKFEGQFGPIMSRWNSILSGLGVQDKNYSVVRSKLTQALGSFLTGETGAQRGMTEVRWLETALPRLIDSGANWDAVLESFQKDLDRDIRFLYNTYGDKGMYVHQWERGMRDAGVQFEPISSGLAAQGGGLNPKAANAQDQSPTPTTMPAAPETVQEGGGAIRRFRVSTPDGKTEDYEVPEGEMAEFQAEIPQEAHVEEL